MNDAFSKIEFSRIREFRVGGIPVVFGRLAQDEASASAPVIYGAALSERDLRNEACGYGTTESGAAAALFRMMRS